MSNKTLNELQMDLKLVLDNVNQKILDCIARYSGDTGGLPELPSFQSLNSSTKIYFEYTAQCIRVGDDIMQTMLSISIVLDTLNKIKTSGISTDTTNNYALLTNFRKYIDDNRERLKNLKYDLFELKRQLNNRIRLLQDINFQK